MQAFRIVQERHVATALNGHGARIYGGRWNRPGLPCVYAAESRSLAMLEILVHLTPRSRVGQWRLLTLEFPDSAVVDSRESGPLPRGWDQSPPSSASQSVGDNWLNDLTSVVLRVPSVLVPEENNILMNPLAPGFEGVQIVANRPHAFDGRLV